MPSSEAVSLRDGIMSEVYAITAEHQRRISNPEDRPLDHDDVTLMNCISALALDAGRLIAVLTAGDLPKTTVHRDAITLATDAAEIARRIRPK